MGNRHEVWWRLAVLVAAALLTASALASGSQGLFSIFGILQGPLTVERVIDGDTFVLENDERVRIIGVDAPEVGEPYANRATALLASLIEDQPIFLEFDVAERDTFGRLLAYAYVEDPDGSWVAGDGRRFTQASYALAVAGLADIMTMPPNVAYAEIYLAATREARDAGRGFWTVWECVDLNTACLERLMEIIHIGESRGLEVMRLRQERPFTRITDLQRVDGIGGVGTVRLEAIIEQGIVCPFE